MSKISFSRCISVKCDKQWQPTLVLTLKVRTQYVNGTFPAYLTRLQFVKWQIFIQNYLFNISMGSKLAISTLKTETSFPKKFWKTQSVHFQIQKMISKVIFQVSKFFEFHFCEKYYFSGKKSLFKTAYFVHFQIQIWFRNYFWKRNDIFEIFFFWK